MESDVGAVSTDAVDISSQCVHKHGKITESCDLIYQKFSITQM